MALTGACERGCAKAQARVQKTISMDVRMPMWVLGRQFGSGLGVKALLRTVPLLLYRGCWTFASFQFLRVLLTQCGFQVCSQTSA